MSETDKRCLGCGTRILAAGLYRPQPVPGICEECEEKIKADTKVLENITPEQWAFIKPEEQNGNN